MKYYSVTVLYEWEIVFHFILHNITGAAVEMIKHLSEKIGKGDWAAELLGHEDSVSSLAFSYDGQLVASGGLDGVVQIFDA